MVNIHLLRVIETRLLLETQSRPFFLHYYLVKLFQMACPPENSTIDRTGPLQKYAFIYVLRM